MPDVILVIEDEPGIVDFLERGLRPHGFEVEVGSRRRQRHGAGADREVDLVVLDLMLPGRSGLEILAELREPSRRCR